MAQGKKQRLILAFDFERFRGKDPGREKKLMIRENTLWPRLENGQVGGLGSLGGAEAASRELWTSTWWSWISSAGPQYPSKGWDVDQERPGALGLQEAATSVYFLFAPALVFCLIITKYLSQLLYGWLNTINCPWFDTQSQTDLFLRSPPLVSQAVCDWPSLDHVPHWARSPHICTNQLFLEAEVSLQPPLEPAFPSSQAPFPRFLQPFLLRALPSKPSACNFTSLTISNLKHWPCRLWVPTGYLESALRAVVAHLSGKWGPGEPWSSRHHSQHQTMWGWGFPGEKLRKPWGLPLVSCVSWQKPLNLSDPQWSPVQVKESHPTGLI